MDAVDLRKKYQEIRNKIPEDKREKKSGRIVKDIERNWQQFDSYDRDFLCFYPLGSEPDLRPLCDWILHNGWNLYFPVTEKDGSHFYRVNDLDGFAKGTFGVMEPVDRSVEYKGEHGVSFTPGLVFDRQMHRIGYGGGYYDRFYAAHPDICRIGICFSECQTEEIPYNEWDKPMDMIFTDIEQEAL